MLRKFYDFYTPGLTFEYFALEPRQSNDNFYRNKYGDFKPPKKLKTFQNMLKKLVTKMNY